MPENYINYYKVSLKELEAIDQSKGKPKLLLHACCGPCSCFPLTFLCPHFDVTIYYGNSNIYPAEEFYRRRGELESLLKYLEKDYGFHVELIMPEYEHEKYMEDLRPYGNEPERGKRCLLCYEKRMEEAYQYAEDHGFDYFTTVMTISRQKDSPTMNRIGEELQKKHPTVRYFYSDFKKNDGILKGAEMRRHYGLYNQTYCGCEYSLASRQAFDAKKAALSNPEENPGD